MSFALIRQVSLSYEMVHLMKVLHTFMQNSDYVPFPMVVVVFARDMVGAQHTVQGQAGYSRHILWLLFL